jgi:hypothetical protein
LACSGQYLRTSKCHHPSWADRDSINWPLKCETESLLLSRLYWYTRSNVWRQHHETAPPFGQLISPHRHEYQQKACVRFLACPCVPVRNSVRILLFSRKHCRLLLGRVT